ncbi:MAG: biotin/lipoyl-binding protein, partial [Actinomycetia bacterium]|nr:biotin/lipoyl-binding protein [Actinomycetes bacterium]
MDKKIVPVIAIAFIAVTAITYSVWDYFKANNDVKGIEASGTIEAQEVTISSELGGKLILVKVDEGSNISKDQLLASIDNEIARAQVRQAEAGVKIAQLKVDIAIAGSREEQIRTAKAKVKQSRAQKTGSQKALDNAILLYSQRTPQKTQVDIAKAQKDVLETQKSGTEKLLDNA